MVGNIGKFGRDDSIRVVKCQFGDILISAGQGKCQTLFIVILDESYSR